VEGTTGEDPTALQRGGDGHKLNQRVRPVADDHLLHWQVAEGDAPDSHSIVVVRTS
jgi:hypothetical protein